MTKRQTKRSPSLGVSVANTLITLTALIATLGGWVGLSAITPAASSAPSCVATATPCDTAVADRSAR